MVPWSWTLWLAVVDIVTLSCTFVPLAQVARALLAWLNLTTCASSLYYTRLDCRLWWVALSCVCLSRFHSIGYLVYWLRSIFSTMLSAECAVTFLCSHISWVVFSTNPGTIAPFALLVCLWHRLWLPAAIREPSILVVWIHPLPFVVWWLLLVLAWWISSSRLLGGMCSSSMLLHMF